MNRKNHREKIFERDAGVCEKCHLDTDAIDARIKKLMMLGAPCSVIDEAFSVHGFSSASTSSLWEADHIAPLSEGGEDTIENMRTLCQPCHREVTADLKSRIARRPKKKRKCKTECEYSPRWSGAQWVQRCAACGRLRKE